MGWVRFWDRGGWMLLPQNSTAVKNSFTRNREFLRAVLSYVNKLNEKRIAVFSSGFTKSLLYVNNQVSGRAFFQPNLLIPFKVKDWKGVSPQQDSFTLSSGFFATAQWPQLLHYLRTYFSFYFLDLQMTCACRILINWSFYFFSPLELSCISSVGRRVTASPSRSFCFSPSCLIAPEKTSHWDGVLEWYFFQHFGIKFQSSCRLRGKIQVLDVGETGSHVRFWHFRESIALGDGEKTRTGLLVHKLFYLSTS